MALGFYGSPFPYGTIRPSVQFNPKLVDHIRWNPAANFIMGEKIIGLSPITEKLFSSDIPVIMHRRMYLR